MVSLSGDGVALRPAEYAQLLQQLLAQADITPDRYLEGGPVQLLQERFAKLLNKEAAVFLPTGTMANHFAVRLLAGEKRRVLVQQESHLYRDENDCAEMLSGLNLLPLGVNRASFTLADVEATVADSGGPPYPMPIAAISIESPVRRQRGAVFPFEEMKKITAFARQRKIGTHLDGARVFLASAYTGVSPTEYAAHFDTVYISLYKYFNAPFGAILAGPESLMSKVPVLRRQFGGGLLHAWEPALIALHYLDGFSERYQSAVRRGNEVMALLEKSGRVRFEKINDGSNIFGMTLPKTDPAKLQQRLRASGIALGAPTQFQVNETLNRRPADEIAADFLAAM